MDGTQLINDSINHLLENGYSQIEAATFANELASKAKIFNFGQSREGIGYADNFANAILNYLENYELREYNHRVTEIVLYFCSQTRIYCVHQELKKTLVDLKEFYCTSQDRIHAELYKSFSWFPENFEEIEG